MKGMHPRFHRLKHAANAYVAERLASLREKPKVYRRPKTRFRKLRIVRLP